MKKVVLGLSGGVDSCVTALMLKENGYQVIAYTFKLLGNEDSLESARMLAEKLGIEFGIIDISEAFKSKIVDPFIEDYLDGETPNPCVWCNNEIKVHFLYQQMLKINADFFATGHYIQIEESENQHYIHKGVDEAKDQSYFLWNVRAKYLKYWLTPLGQFTKKEVKQIAIDHKMGFLAHRKESMGVCFIGQNGYGEFLEEHKPEDRKIEAGNILDEKQNVLGQHQGTAHYTIGQKKGLEVEEKGMVVTKINAKDNTLVVGKNESLYVRSLKVRNYYFVSEADMYDPQLIVIVRGLGRNPEGFCQIKAINSEAIEIQLEGTAWALAPGQPVGFYIGERLAGGGYIM